MIKSQIVDAQEYIKKITGVKPNIISYPNGNYSKEIIDISKKVGIKLGISVDFKKNYLPINTDKFECMHLGRFDLSGGKDILKQCKLFRSDFLIYPKIMKNF